MSANRGVDIASTGQPDALVQYRGGAVKISRSREHVLERFPGALFDSHGYIVFENERAFLSCSYLHIGEEINVLDPKGIVAIPGYGRIR